MKIQPETPALAPWRNSKESSSFVYKRRNIWNICILLAHALIKLFLIHTNVNSQTSFFSSFNWDHFSYSFMIPYIFLIWSLSCMTILEVYIVYRYKMWQVLIDVVFVFYPEPSPNKINSFHLLKMFSVHSGNKSFK